VRTYFAGILSAGAAGIFAGQDDGSRVRTDESGDAAHVDSLRSVLFGFTLSGGDSASRAGAAPYRCHRCNARKHAARHEHGATYCAGGDIAGVVRRAVHSLSADLPLEIEVPDRKPAMLCPIYKVLSTFLLKKRTHGDLLQWHIDCGFMFLIQRGIT